MRAVAIFAALAALGSDPTSAKSSLLAPILADPVWEVEAGTDAGKELILDRNGVVTSARVLPGRVVALSENAASSTDGKILVAKGAALFLYHTIHGEVFCASALLKLDGGKIPCLIDSDRDGRFDRAMRILVPESPGRFGAGIIGRGDPTAITPIGSTALEPRDYAAPQLVRIVMTGSGRDNASFNVVINVRGKDVPIRGLYGRAKGAFPAAADVFGARIVVLGVEGKATHIRIERAIPKQAFQLSDGII